MTFLFRNDISLNKIRECTNLFLDSWMSLGAGEGEEEIENHGRSRVKSFSQETEAIGQQAPRIGSNGLKLKSLKCRMHERFQTQLPNFFSSSRAV
jgi:hypothetical protein